MAVTSNTTITPAQLAALATLANTKGSLAGTPYSFPDSALIPVSGSPSWLTELNRLAQNLNAAASSLTAEQKFVLTDVPFSLSKRSTFGTIYSGLRYSLYFEDTGSSEHITVTYSYTASGGFMNTSPIANEGSAGVFTCNITVDKDINFGGGQLQIGWTALGTTPLVTPSPYQTVSQSTNWPNTTWALPEAARVFYDPFPYIRVNAGSRFNIGAGFVAAGTYTFSVTFPSGFSFYLGAFQVANFTVPISAYGGTPVPRLDSAAAVLMLTTKPPFLYLDSTYNPFSQLGTIVPSTGSPIVYSNSSAFSTSGYVLAFANFNHQKRSDLGELMPWNLGVKLWKPLYFYAAAQIVDSNGNLQTLTTAGLSGSIRPNWGITQTLAGQFISPFTKQALFLDTLVGVSVGSTVTGPGLSGTAIVTAIYPASGGTPAIAMLNIASSIYTTGNYSFTGITIDGGCTWTYAGFAPLQSRLASAPRYPFVWDSDPTTFIPGACPAAPAGWWIYKVALNRVLGTTPIPVDIGCYRSGSFVLFGSWLTGQTVDAMWPIFDNGTPLVYKCSERIDLQASIINMADPTPAAGEYFHYPLAADNYNAVIALLNLIS